MKLHIAIFARIVLLIVCSGTGRLFAQHHDFHNLNMKDGLPSSFVYEVFEDSKGYLWMLTEKGIARYNGTQFRLFTQQDGYEEGGAYHVVEDREGTLWFITVSFKVFGFKNGRFFKVKTDQRITWIDLDSNGKRWLLNVTRNEVNVLELHKDGSISHRLLIPITQMSYSLLHLKEGRFLVGCGEGVWVFGKGFVKQVLKVYTKVSYISPRFFQTPQYTLISAEDGIYALTPDLSVTLVFPLRRNEVFDIYQDPETMDIWVGSSKGLLRFKNGNFASKPETFLESNSILSIYKAKDRTLWISTFNKGVFICNVRAKHYTDVEGFETNRLIYVKRENDNIYVFSHSSTFYKIEAHKALAMKLPMTHAMENESKNIGFVQSVNDTVIIINAQAHWAIQHGKLHPYCLKYSIVGQDVKWNKGILQNTPNDDLVLDTMLILTREQKYSFMNQLKEAGILLEKEHPVFIENDTFYYSTTIGLVCVKFSDSGAVYYSIPFKGKVSQVTRFKEILIVCTETNGVYLIKGNTCKNITSIDGLASDYVSRCLVHNGRLWACTNKGISLIDLSSPALISNFTAMDYLIDNEVNDVLIHKDTVYAVTSMGLSVFPAKVKFPEYAPSVYFERIQVNNKDTVVQSEYTLPYTSNNITVHFSSPGYRSGRSNVYRCIISSSNDADTGYYASGTLHLSSLMPGSYKVSVSVKNIDGMWSRETSFYVKINQPLWKTWWFILAMTVICITVVGLIIWINLKRHKQKQEYDRKIAESELRSLRLYMNPHFIFNSLTSLQSFILTNRNKDANIFISKFSKLIRSVMNYSLKGEISLYEEINLLRNYLELEKVRFGDEFEFAVEADTVKEQYGILIPSLLIQPFAENAIKHGLSGLKGRRGYLRISFEQENGLLYCTIEDNGKGRPEVRERETDHFSSGIKFTEDRIKLVIKEKVKNTVEITDLKQNDTPTGTRVKILVPVLNK